MKHIKIVIVVGLIGLVAQSSMVAMDHLGGGKPGSNSKKALVLIEEKIPVLENQLAVLKELKQNFAQSWDKSGGTGIADSRTFLESVEKVLDLPTKPVGVGAAGCSDTLAGVVASPLTPRTQSLSPMPRSQSLRPKPRAVAASNQADACSGRVSSGSNSPSGRSSAPTSPRQETPRPVSPKSPRTTTQKSGGDRAVKCAQTILDDLIKLYTPITHKESGPDREAQCFVGAKRLLAQRSARAGNDDRVKKKAATMAVKNALENARSKAKSGRHDAFLLSQAINEKIAELGRTCKESLGQLTIQPPRAVASEASAEKRTQRQPAGPANRVTPPAAPRATPTTSPRATTPRAVVKPVVQGLRARATRAKETTPRITVLPAKAASTAVSSVTATAMASHAAAPASTAGAVSPSATSLRTPAAAAVPAVATISSSSVASSSATAAAPVTTVPAAAAATATTIATTASSDEKTITCTSLSACYIARFVNGMRMDVERVLKGLKEDTNKDKIVVAALGNFTTHFKNSRQHETAESRVVIDPSPALREGARALVVLVAPIGKISQELLARYQGGVQAILKNAKVFARAAQPEQETPDTQGKPKLPAALSQLNKAIESLEKALQRDAKERPARSRGEVPDAGDVDDNGAYVDEDVDCSGESAIETADVPRNTGRGATQGCVLSSRTQGAAQKIGGRRVSFPTDDSLAQTLRPQQPQGPKVCGGGQPVKPTLRRQNKPVITCAAAAAAAAAAGALVGNDDGTRGTADDVSSVVPQGRNPDAREARAVAEGADQFFVALEQLRGELTKKSPASEGDHPGAQNFERMKKSFASAVKAHAILLQRPGEDSSGEDSSSFGAGEISQKVAEVCGVLVTVSANLGLISPDPGANRILTDGMLTAADTMVRVKDAYGVTWKVNVAEAFANLKRTIAEIRSGGRHHYFAKPGVTPSATETNQVNGCSPVMKRTEVSVVPRTAFGGSAHRRLKEMPPVPTAVGRRAERVQQFKQTSDRQGERGAMGAISSCPAASPDQESSVTPRAPSAELAYGWRANSDNASGDVRTNASEEQASVVELARSVCMNAETLLRIAACSSVAATGGNEGKVAEILRRQRSLANSPSQQSGGHNVRPCCQETAEAAVARAHNALNVVFECLEKELLPRPQQSDFGFGLVQLKELVASSHRLFEGVQKHESLLFARAQEASLADGLLALIMSIEDFLPQQA